MKTLVYWLAPLLTILAGRAETDNFDQVTPGTLPAHWLATQTGQGAADWKVVTDASAPTAPNVLKQSGTAAYPICVRTNVVLQDGFVEVKFKAVTGEEDQAGGLIWRYQDPANYYVARANALEDNITIYHTVKGKRTELKRFKLKVAPETWHDLRVEFTGSRFTVLFNSQKALEIEDRTFLGAGAVGLWTKADSVTLFDNFRYGRAEAR